MTRQQRQCMEENMRAIAEYGQQAERGDSYGVQVVEGAKELLRKEFTRAATSGVQS